MQSQHSLMYREEEAEMFAFCKETGVGLIPWYPLNAGPSLFCLYAATHSRQANWPVLLTSRTPPPAPASRA
jgi:aryl-alcohol dehydrogenase-like predicted oxidoreductase